MIQENTLISEKEVLDRLVSRKDLYTPFEITSVEREVVLGDRRVDARITLSWRGRAVPFLAEIKARTAPKLVTEAVWQLRSYAGNRKENLLLIVPFLSKTIVEILEREGMSGLDLNGNYLIQTPEMAAIRLDRANQFTESQSIKKIFSGNSSLVGRLFLSSKRRFGSVNEVCAAIRELGGSLSLSAVSKVLKGLESELIIEKGPNGIALLQPEKLLQSLQDGYRAPKILATMKLKLPVPEVDAVQNFGKILPPSISWVLSGESSVERYAVTTVGAVATVYATDFGPLAPYETDRFFNVILKKTLDSFPYFDMQTRTGLRWSSPVQCYLELSKMDKRERELADIIRTSILEGVK